MQRQLGSTTFELLICLLLGTPLLLCATLLLTSAAKSQAKLKSVDLRVTTVSTIHALLTRAMLDLDSLPFSLPPRILESGLIRFADGTNNPVMHGAASRRPHLESEALSAIRLATAYSFSVVSQHWNGAFLSLEGCPRFERLPADFEPFHSYLALSIERAYELVPQAPPVPGPHAPRCRVFELEAQKSMLTSAPPQGEPILVLIPIKDSYTLYLDRSLRLRYLSHAGAQNIENQPIMDQAPTLSFGFNAADAASAPILTAKLRFSNSTEEQLAITGLLPGSRKTINFLLNY